LNLNLEGVSLRLLYPSADDGYCPLRYLGRMDGTKQLSFSVITASPAKEALAHVGPQIPDTVQC